MKEHPILFSAPMVRAILDGCKTQTRRVMKPQLVAMRGAAKGGYIHEPCPFVQAGDRLWVRETWFREPHPSDLGLTYEDMPHTWAFACAKAGQFLYRADPSSEIAIDGRQWRPSIHMPRAACRLELEVTGVRVERLQDISYEDALAEGVGDMATICEQVEPSWRSAAREDIQEAARRLRWPQRAFENLWAKINGTDSWTANPWVWVVEFKRVQP